MKIAIIGVGSVRDQVRVDEIIKRVENETGEKVEIVDILGKPIISRKSNYEAVDMSQFNNGIYFVKIYTEKNIITRKFIKQ